MSQTYQFRSLIIVMTIQLSVSLAVAGDLDEFKIKREDVYEFIQKPSVARNGDRFEVAFETKGWCDASVAIEDAQGRVVRHLASGVLGPYAPEPFQKSAKKQLLIWDGKDDREQYVERPQACAVRVSLGLDPHFERTLYWTPARRCGNEAPVLRATKDGMLVYDGKGFDHLRLFGHDGTFVRTIYPFSAERVQQVQGLNWHDFPQGGHLPAKSGFVQQTLLTSGENSCSDLGATHQSMEGNAATALAVRGERIAMVKERLNRLAMDGTSGGLPISGSATTKYTAENSNHPFYGPQFATIKPWSAAFSPDGKWVYLAGYAHRHGDARMLSDFTCMHGITRIPFETDGPLEVFLGAMEEKSNRYNNRQHASTADGRFQCAAWVECDAQGRVYVADHMNDRVQIFSPEGKFLKAIPVEKPAKLQFHPENGDLYVLSWVIHNPKWDYFECVKYEPALTCFGNYDNPAKRWSCKIPVPRQGIGQGPSSVYGPMQAAELDLFQNPPNLWIACAAGVGGCANPPWDQYHISLHTLQDGKWVPQKSLGKETAQVLGRTKFPNAFPQIQYLYVNPGTGKLYLGEPDGSQAFSQLVEIDPETGKSKVIDLPFQALDAAFDQNGHIYLRTVNVVGRYEFATWREVPWDYGEELLRVGSQSDKKTAPLISGLVFPCQSTNQGHQGGMSVTPKGDLVLSCVNLKPESRQDQPALLHTGAKPYTPRLFPGRLARESVQVFSKRGQLMIEDAAPGLGRLDGVYMDVKENLYAMSVGHRILEGQRYFNNKSSTLVKVPARKSRIVSSTQDGRFSPVTLPKDAWPKRTPDLYGMGDMWLEGAAWFYGGVGFAGKNIGGDSEMGCCCWHATFTLDGYARSFAPEVDQYRVAVLDSNGNLMLRIGRYGNVEDGKPLIPEGGPSQTHALGGDETALFHACYVAAHSDHRLFIADAGNARIVSVKLNYHESATVALENASSSAPATTQK